MGMSRCYSLMKCLLILFNIIFLVVGCGACGAAGWALWDGRAGETPQGRAALCALAAWGAVLALGALAACAGAARYCGVVAGQGLPLAAWGAVLALGALAACAGAARQSASLLACAFLLLALTAVAAGAAGWWGAAHLPQLRAALADRLRHSVTAEYGQRDHATEFIDAIQRGLECCGSEGARDWQDSAWARAQAGPVAAAEEGAGVEGGGTLDLSVGARAAHYRVPASCCETLDETECAVARVVPAAAGGARGLRAAGCAARVLAALEAGARAPLAAAAALLALHALTLLLTAALCLRANPAPRYKA